MGDPILAVCGLHAGYGGTEILRGVDLNVGTGEIVAVLGSNGAGKSTLNRAISGVLRPSRGTIRFGHADIEREKPAAIVERGLIHVPEGRHIFPNMTVRENLDLGAYRRARANRDRNRGRVFALFPRLAERSSQRAGTLSGGEQQMLAIGRGLMAEPRLLLLDEPSLGLSPLLVDELFALIRRINAEGISLLLVEQNVVQSLDVAQRAYILDNGMFVLQGISPPTSATTPTSNAPTSDYSSMEKEKPFDLVIKNARVVRPNKASLDCLDIAVTDGKVARLAPEIRAEQARDVFDAGNLLAFPGCVDAHMHIGIYAPLAQDAVSESKAAAMGGVTSSLNYIRTGRYYLNRGGPYRDFMPEFLRQSAGRFWVDYGYHVAPIEAGHIDEMEDLVLDHGITSFKIFMFYGDMACTDPRLTSMNS